MAAVKQKTTTATARSRRIAKPSLTVESVTPSAARSLRAEARQARLTAERAAREVTRAQKRAEKAGFADRRLNVALIHAERTARMAAKQAKIADRRAQGATNLVERSRALKNA